MTIEEWLEMLRTVHPDAVIKAVAQIESTVVGAYESNGKAHITYKRPLEEEVTSHA